MANIIPPIALNNKLVRTTGPAWNKPVKIIVLITAMPKKLNTTRESYWVIQDINPPLLLEGFTIVLDDILY